MSKLTIHNKSDKYGDLHMGYYVCEQLASFTGIDLRNPATVKFARLLLGNGEAVRDSIDDIVSYAWKSNGLLDFKPNTEVPETAKTILCILATIQREYGPVPPGALAYLTAYFAAIWRGEHFLAIELLTETFGDSRSGFGDIAYPLGLLKSVIRSTSQLMESMRNGQEETNK